jgi:hypothetical protein
MSRQTVASLDARIVALEALVAELKTQRAVAPVQHLTTAAGSQAEWEAEKRQMDAEWAAKKAAAIAEAKRTGKSVVMNCSH